MVEGTRDTAGQQCVEQGGRCVECGVYFGGDYHRETDIPGDVDSQPDREGDKVHWTADESGCGGHKLDSCWVTAGFLEENELLRVQGVAREDQQRRVRLAQKDVGVQP